MDKSRIAITFLIVLSNTIGATVILPMMPLYVEKQFGATPLQATLVIAAFYAAQLLAAPWLGKLSDQVGRRPILIVSQLGTLAAYLLFFFAAPLGRALDGAGLALGLSGGLAVIYLARILDGLTGGNVSVAEAYASDISDEPSRTQALGLIGGAIGVGHILGPALAAILSRISLMAPIVGAAIMSAVTLLLTIVLLDETLGSGERVARHALPAASMQRIVWRPPVLIVASTALVMGLYVAGVMSSFALYAERALFPGQPPEVVAQNVGLVIVLMGVGVAVSQMVLVGPLVESVGEQVVVVAGGALLTVSAIGFGAATTAAGVAIAILAYALGYSISWPSLQTIMTRFGSKESVGRLLGLFQSAFSLALILAPAAAGLIMETVGARAVFYSGAWLMGLGTSLAVVLAHLNLPHGDGTPAAPGIGSDWQSLLKRFHR